MRKCFINAMKDNVERKANGHNKENEGYLCQLDKPQVW